MVQQVEEQSVTTTEIAGNIHRTATQGEELSSGIENVAVGSKTTSTRAEEMLGIGHSVRSLVADLQKLISQFQY